MHTSSAGLAYVHLTLRRLHAQQLRVPLRVFRRFRLRRVSMLLLFCNAMVRWAKVGAALDRVSRLMLNQPIACVLTRCYECEDHFDGMLRILGDNFPYRTAVDIK